MKAQVSKRIEKIVADMKRKGFNVDVVSRYIKSDKKLTEGR
ncbi:hypothetical protein [Priestia flexa]|jgi:uncharacterized protein (UPF0335 family)|nr:hypothetical protein [Priestia flexa]